MQTTTLPKILGDEVRVAVDLWLPFTRQYGLASTFIPIAGLYDIYIARLNFNTLPIRCLMCVALIFMCTHKHWNHAWQDQSHLVWSIVVIFVLPFGFGFMLTQSAANTAIGSEVHYMLLLQYVTALFLLILICNSIRVTVLFWTIGTACVLVPLHWQEIQNYPELYRVTVLSVGAYLTMILIGSVANQNIRLTEEAKAEAAHIIGSNIAHELRTPLAAIRMYAKGTTNQIEILLEAYTKARLAGLDVATLRPNQVQIMKELFEAIDREVNYSNTIIDMLLVKSGRKIPDRREFDHFNVSLAIREAMNRYPANNQHERNIQRVEVIRDFEVVAPKLLIVHVFFNLLKNAVYYSQKSSDSYVRVQIGRSGVKENVVIVEDNGPGLSVSEPDQIFERFFTTTLAGEGTGIGLSFCRLVIEEIGGSISVSNENSQRTTFQLIFPAGKGNRRRRLHNYITAN